MHCAARFYEWPTCCAAIDVLPSQDSARLAQILHYRYIVIGSVSAKRTRTMHWCYISRVETVAVEQFELEKRLLQLKYDLFRPIYVRGSDLVR